MTVDGASKYYQTSTGPVHALDDVSLEVREGEFLCILGPSGCGKTTLLWSMGGLHDLSGGEIRLGDEPITAPHPEIAMIFQDANLLPWRNLEGNISLPFELKRIPPDRQRIRSFWTVWVSAVSRPNFLASCRAACSSAPRSCAACRSTRPFC